MQTCSTATEVTASDSQWSSGWYVVPAGTVTISQRVTVNGDVHLILENGAELLIDGGISVAGSNALTIYAQSVEEGEMGILAADASSRYYDAGIGGDGYSAPNAGAVTICGGEIIVKWSANGGAGIGGGGANNTGGAGGTVTISGGNVKADSYDGAGIGGGSGAYPAADGTFSTGSSGNAVIYSSSIQDASQQKQWQGIFFLENQGGQVYGEMTLAEDFTIPTDKTLVIGEGQTLIIPTGVTLDTQNALTNNGTLVIQTGGQLNGTPTGSGTVITAPTITTESLDDGTVGTAYNQTQPLAATGNNITWSLDSGTLPTGLTLNSDGTITGTPSAEGSSTFTVKAENSAGSASKEYTLNIKPATVSVTGVTLDPTELSLYTGESETLTAKVQPANATNKNMTWESSDPNVVTVEDGTVTAVKAGEATITVKTVDGGFTATCKVKVTEPVYSISADISPDFGSVYTGYDRPAAQTVTVTNTGNQSLTLNQPASTSHFEVGTLSKTPLAPGEKATFTVQPKAGLAAGVYREEIQVSGSGNVTLSIPVSFSVQAAAAPQVTPAPATTPAPSDNITYYTCQACGYHNWTATEAGYRCDHCGYLESTRQLSGYGNVKGSYTPGSSAAAPAASTIPQTGDESNPVLWTVLLLVSGLALGGLALRRKTEHSRS